MEDEPGDYLKVPITEPERIAARSRSNSNQRLLPDSSHSSDKEFGKDYEKDYVEGPSRFPSIRGETGPPAYLSVKPDGSSGGQYSSVSPIDEEDTIDNPPGRQRTIYQSEKFHQPLGPLPELWQPIWLKRLTLALFAILFIVLTVVFIVLWVLSENRGGFYVKNPHGHKFFQYIPTILLVFIVALWRQVDYHTKALIPWDELQKGPVGPKKSLLLDYISPLQVVSLFKAFLAGHIPIIATVSTFILLKIVTVFSTGSIILLPTHITRNDFPLLSTLRFDSTSFDPTRDISVSSSPVYSYYGSMAQGMPWQSGTLPDRAYMPVTFDSNSDTRPPQNVTLTGNVDSFVPLMDCHTIDGTLQTSSTTSQSGYADAYRDGTISFDLPAGDICGFWAPINITALNPQRNIVPSRQVSGAMQAVYCATGTDGPLDASTGPAALLYTVTDISYEQDLLSDAAVLAGGSYTIASSSSRTLEKMVNVICKPSYTVGQVKVTNDTTKDDTQAGGITVESVANSGNKTLDNLSDWNMTNLFVAAITSARNMFGDVGREDEHAQANNTLFSLMALTQGSQDIDVLLDTGKLNIAAASTYKGITAQYARQSLAHPHDTHFSGTAAFKETRYRINGASAIVMIVAFGVAAFCSILLIFIAPKKVVPRDPNSIATSATVLSRSVEVNRLLRREGTPSLENQEAALEGYEFGTAIATTERGQSSFKIVTSEGLPEVMRHKPEKKLKWWQPLTASIPFAVVVIALPLILVVLLEVYQRSSDRNDGIREVPDNLETDIYTHFIPALIMIIVASLVNLIDFNIELFAPWAELKKGDATHRQSILSHYLGMLAPTALLGASKSRQFNVIASAAAAMIASILAIVAAGLFNTTAAISTSNGVALNRLDNFQTDWSDSRVTDRGAAGMINTVLRDDLSYPAFTYRDLAFPRFSIGEGLDFQNRPRLTEAAHAAIPALRPNLRCDALPASSLNLTTATANGSDRATVSITYPLPPMCQLGGVDGSSSNLRYSLGVSLPSQGSVFAGRVFDLLFGANASTHGNAGEFNGQYIGNNPPVGCPSLAFTYGEFEMASTDADKVSALVCYQEIQQVKAKVTLRSNTTVIDPTHPPVVDDSSITLLSNPNDKNVRSFDWRLQGNFMRQLTSFSTGARDEDFDHFFEAALNFNSTHPISPASLVGPDSVESLRETINTFYRLYMTQAINLNVRKPIVSLNSTSSLARRQNLDDDRLATLTTSTATVRLVQNRGPKVALQVMLALISLLTSFAYLTTPFRRVLPCNPCSIAGTMSLLAGSDLCHSVDDGVCECCGRPRRNSFGTIAETIHADNDEVDEGERQQGIPHGAEWLRMGLFEMVFAGKRYSMGWWRERRDMGKRRRFGVDVGGRADGSDDQDWELGPRASDNSRVPFLGQEGVRGRGNRDGRGAYYMPGHSRDVSQGGSELGEREVEMDDGDLGRGPRGGRGGDYMMVGGLRGEA